MRRPHYETTAAPMDIAANKGAWTKQEDEKLVAYINKHGEGCWRTIPLAAGLLRCGKSCRLRWVNYLKPGLKRGNFSEDEEDLIIKLHALLGNRWSLIAGRLPGRTDNEVKNYWNTHLKRKLLKMGINPNKHRIHHTHPHLRASEQSSKLETTNEENCLDIPLKSSLKEEASNRDCVSDLGSCLLEDYSSMSTTNCELPDLNLDLTLVMDSPRSSLGISSIVKDEQQGNWKDESIFLRETEKPTSPTLLLFT